MNALQMTVVPLVVALILSAIVRPSGGAPVGALGGRAVALFMVLMVTAGIVTLLASGQILSLFSPPPGLLESLQGQTIPPALEGATSSAPEQFGDWLVGLIPRNPLEAAVRGDILQILIFTVVIGLALGRLPSGQRDPLAAVFRSLSDAMLILVGWIMWGTPVAVFSIVLALTLGAGLAVVGLVVLFFVMVCGALLLATGALYPAAAWFGRTSIRRFARAALPSQIIAATTQSSLASLPALIDGGRSELELSEESTGFVLPLCVSVFKMNQPVSSVVKAMFLAHFFGVSVTPGEWGAYLVGAILIGFTSVGIPRGGTPFSRLPLYLALGIPIEAYLVLEAVRHNPIYDACATVLNVTGDMAAATMLSRGERGTRG
jgi:Na+/H+-dicarboxylate symporter